MEQSRQVTCAAGQMNVNTGTRASLEWTLAVPELWPWLIAALAIVIVVVVVANVIDAVVDFVDEAIDYFFWQSGNSDDGEEDGGDTSSDNDVAPSSGGTPSPEQDPNNKGREELAKLIKTAVQTTKKTIATIETAKTVIQGGTAGTIGKLFPESYAGEGHKEIVYGSDAKSESKLYRQMQKRGWTKELVQSTVDNPYTTRKSTNKATGNTATVYYNEDGSHVILDDVSNEVIQVSDRGDLNWAPDGSIIDPYIPKGGE